MRGSIKAIIDTIDQPVSVGIVTEDVAPFDLSADEVMQRPGASMRAFRGMWFTWPA